MPTLTVEQLGTLNKEFIQSLPARIPPSEQAKAVLENTLEDQKEGILSDWLSAQELDDYFGPGAWMASIRFAIWQKSKIQNDR